MIKNHHNQSFSNIFNNNIMMSSLHNSPTQPNVSKPKLQSLPSFSELLTSIPSLPLSTPTQSSFMHFKSRSNSNSSTSSSIPINFANSQHQHQHHQNSVVTSPYNYYSQPSVHHRLPTPPLNPTNNVVVQKQYVSYQPQQFVAPQPMTSSFRNSSTSSNIDPITPITTNFDHKIRSSSTGDIPHSSPQSSVKSIITTSTMSTNTTQASPIFQEQKNHNQYQDQITSPTSSTLSTTSTSTSPKLPLSNSTSTSLSPKDPRRKHVCRVCSRSFTTSGHLARHNRIHTGERKHECPWPSCEARFARQDNCMQHYKTHTNGKNKRSRIYNNYNSQLNKDNSESINNLRDTIKNNLNIDNGKEVGNERKDQTDAQSQSQAQQQQQQNYHQQQVQQQQIIHQQHYQQPVPPPQYMTFTSHQHQYPISSHSGRTY
ncbi:NRG1 [Candida pseudojiufengensis]|uniref:NRG1 n=1 Tax=Candida pseudojiufengensis TaxID=497109 RepID=UPI002224350C|nr:NRG1 [Candida pseudojiufengensis]KAI5960805.1 NRG1 [Candida pseudojiufengensis]